MSQTYAENQTVVGYFDNQSSAERAVQQLQDAGFSSAHLGVAHRGSRTSSDQSTHDNKEGVWDKIKNFFEGNPEPYAEERDRGEMATREITDPYPNTATGQYGYGSSDLHGSLTGMSVPENRSRYFQSRFSGNNDGALVTVNAGDRAPEAERILRENGADLGDNAAEYPATGAGYADAQSSAAGTGNLEDVQNIQLLGEVLRVHKDRVQRGEVTVRKEVITENQTIQVPVTREELVIERRPTTDATPQGTVGDGREIRIPLTAETASVDKQTVVREEVAVGKKPVSEVRDLSGEVRREELVVDDQTKRAVNE